MKTRNFLVSNSSNSSFIILGDKISLQDVPKHSNVILITDDEVYGEGVDKIILTPEIYQTIVENFDDIHTTVKHGTIIVNPEFKSTEYDFYDETEREFPDGFKCDISYHTTKDDLDMFKERYLEKYLTNEDDE